MLTEFRTTLHINPKHEGARKQLGGGRKKDDALGNGFKKLFSGSISRIRRYSGSARSVKPP